MKATGSDAFRHALAPTIGTVRDLADAVSERAGQCGHHPSASSRAMEEIAAEATFAARSGGWKEPIGDTHTFGGMTLTAAADLPTRGLRGVWGYEHLREVLADPADEEHREMLEWLGLQTAAEFDPARFDVDEVNRTLGSSDDARRAVRRAA
jgi:hypothetical protein